MLAKITVGVILIGALLALIKITSPFLAPLKRLWPMNQAAWSLLKSPQSVLDSTQDRTNLVILGKGGAGHEAPDLTDTIIAASYNHKTKKALLVSLPRDMWIDSLQAKLNTAYYYGNQKRPGGGLILAKAAVEEIINQPIHYVIIIDFNGFQDSINLVGGVDIDVPQAFDDLKYPIPGKENSEPESTRYEHLHFDAGKQHLDGGLALKYVRSRHAEGLEGTDYARAARQQQVIVALQTKLLTTQTLLNPQKLTGLLSIAQKSLETNITGNALPAVVKIAAQFDHQQLTSITLDQGDKDTGREGLLINPPPQKYQGQWVLTGKNGNWQAVQAYISNLLP